MQAIVRNAAGIHCRPSACIVKAVIGYPGEIRVLSPNGECDPRSIIALISLGLEEGTPVTIRVEGPDEEEQCRRLVELFETHFDFPERKPGEDTQALLGGLRAASEG
ncbi:MAG: HPr family phosphocarrier protein [Kiritimatiellae bacterium]|nr:HPr family phosphocarrier protein [Kiritimatiellia bacterium]MDW8459386.1 HPr family phosphocarrier protein [Verrucomicrobiota bacterium]